MNDPVIQRTNSGVSAQTTGQGVSTQTTSTLKDLVFNPETGDFEQVNVNDVHDGDTVTKMSIDRFAGNDAESQDLQNSMQSDSSQTSTHLKRPCV
jgi:hypothetical protein